MIVSKLSLRKSVHVQNVNPGYPPIPGTPTLARAYEEGILDASFGQVISFASDYQTSFRIEVPLWHKIEDAIADPGLQ